MTKKTETKKAERLDELFVLDFGGGKPRGARFDKCTDIVVSAIREMSLTFIHPASEAFAELAKKLPKGRVYASGKAFVPNIRRDLYDKLVAQRESPGDSSQVHRYGPAAQDIPVACISPMLPGLPRSWDSVGVGHMVLVHESPEDGWWEAVILQRDDEVLTLRFRDYPKQPTFVRHISTIALVNPGPADPAASV